MPRMAAGIATSSVTGQLDSPTIAQANAICVSTRVKRRIPAIESHDSTQPIVVGAAGLVNVAPAQRRELRHILWAQIIFAIIFAVPI
jgi:hypothetical protein